MTQDKKSILILMLNDMRNMKAIDDNIYSLAFDRIKRLPDEVETCEPVAASA